MNKKKGVLSFFVIFVVIVACSLFFSQESESDTFKIGAILSLTGRGAKYGNDALHGIKIALDEINNKGGINGCQAEVIVEDSMSESKNAISAYKKLIEIHNVKAVIGPILSDEVLAVAPEANRKKVLIIAPAAGSDKISEAGPYVFRNRESAMLQSVEIAKYILKQPSPQRIAIVFSTTANAVSYKDAFLRALGDEQERVVMEEAFAEGQNDFRTIILKLKNESATHVFVPGLAPEIARILVQAREAGLETQWLSTGGANDQRLLEISGLAAEGLIFSTSSLETNDPTSPTSKLNECLQKEYGTKINLVSANSYDAVLMLASAAESAQKNSNSLRDELELIKKFPGAGGETTFVNPGTVIKPIALKVVLNGEFVSLEF